MNIFFYASAVSVAAEKFSEQLYTRDSLSTMTVLPGGSRLNSHHGLTLRSGDVMLLFADTDKELDELLLIRDKFEEFRVILVLSERVTQVNGMSYMLKPRFVTYVDSDVSDLEKVIVKIQSKAKTTR